MNRIPHRIPVATTCAVALAAFGLGAAIMYVLDPESGKRRRTYARDSALDAANEAADAIEATARDLRNRAQGTVAEVKGVFSPNQPTAGE
jgi:hypothetical protein